MRSPLRLVLCDDALGFPQLVATWVERSEGLELVASTSTEAGLLDALPAARPDVLLLDYMLPEGPTTPARLSRVRELAPGARVVLVSSLPAMALQDEADRLGVDAWLSKVTTAPELLATLTGDR